MRVLCGVRCRAGKDKHCTVLHVDSKRAELIKMETRMLVLGAGGGGDGKTVVEGPTVQLAEELVLGLQCAAQR